MEFSHVPVLLNECLDALKIIKDGIYADGTVGGAGHSSQILKRLSKDGTLVGLDRDNEALAAAKSRLEDELAAMPEGGRPKYYLVKSNYGDMPQALKNMSSSSQNIT